MFKYTAVFSLVFLIFSTTPMLRRNELFMKMICHGIQFLVRIVTIIKLQTTSFYVGVLHIIVFVSK